MGFNVVYADKDKIESSIAQGVIPKESLILSQGEGQSEASYYDDQGKLRYITKKNSFSSMVEALTWINKYDYQGEIISIRKDNQWVPYTIDDNKKLIPIQSEYEVIDGGGVPN